MATGSISKVRLVKCPECMRLLLEEKGLAIYKCGGCGTFLQAKIRRKPDAVNVSQGQGSSSTTRNQTLDEALKNNLIVPDTDQLDSRGASSNSRVLRRWTFSSQASLVGMGCWLFIV